MWPKSSSSCKKYKNSVLQNKKTFIDRSEESTLKKQREDIKHLEYQIIKYIYHYYYTGRHWCVRHFSKTHCSLVRRA